MCYPLREKTNFPKPQDNPQVQKVIIWMSSPKGHNPFSRTLRGPMCTWHFCPNGSCWRETHKYRKFLSKWSSYGTKPIFQNLKKTHLNMRFLSKWVLLKNKTHFSKSQKNLQVQNLHTLMWPFLGKTHLYKNLHSWKQLSFYGTQKHFKIGIGGSPLGIRP